MAAKIDPIRARYYRPLETVEDWSSLIFYVTAIASIAVLLINKADYPTLYATTQTAFVIFVVASAVLGLAIKLYLGPRAQEKRVSDFVSSAFGVNLTPERTTGYYNNKAIDAPRRAALQLLENSYFTKEIARLMLVRRRAIFVIYVVIWLVVIASRSTPIDLVAGLATVVFGEEILSTWARLEWLRARAERIFEAMFRQWKNSQANTPSFAASAMESFALYECDKSTSAITLSSRLFDKYNVRLSAEWENLRKNLEGN